MTRSYNKLLKLMIDKKINKTQLREQAGITSNAMAKISKDEPVSIEVLEKICGVLECNIEDIVEIIPEYGDAECKNLILLICFQELADFIKQW